MIRFLVIVVILFSFIHAVATSGHHDPYSGSSCQQSSACSAAYDSSR